MSSSPCCTTPAARSRQRWRSASRSRSRRPPPTSTAAWSAPRSAPAWRSAPRRVRAAGDAAAGRPGALSRQDRGPQPARHRGDPEPPPSMRGRALRRPTWCRSAAAARREGGSPRPQIPCCRLRFAARIHSIVLVKPSLIFLIVRPRKPPIDRRSSGSFDRPGTGSECHDDIAESRADGSPRPDADAPQMKTVRAEGRWKCRSAPTSTYAIFAL